MVGRVLVEVHHPRSPTAEVSIARAGGIAVAIRFCSGRLIHAHTALSILKPGIGKTSSITGNDASEMEIGNLVNYGGFLFISCVLVSTKLIITYSSGVFVVEFLIEPASIC